jgi:CheY-like chemotaxis protein
MKNLRMRFATVPDRSSQKGCGSKRDAGSTRLATNNGSHIFLATRFTGALYENPKRSTSKLVGGQSDYMLKKLQLVATTIDNVTPRRVLIVGDERVIAGSLVTILRRAGYEVAVSYDALGAISECMSFRPELVITDVVISGVSGTEMAILIQERCPACKILLFSGQAATAKTLEEAGRSGYDFDLLLKPINPKDLLAKPAAEILHRGPSIIKRGKRTT